MKISNPKSMLHVNIQSRGFVYLTAPIRPADRSGMPGHSKKLCQSQNSSSIPHIDRVPIYS